MATHSLVIVAIDDEPDNLITLKAVLADVFPGAEVKTATNGPQGIELARTEDPDVILLDVVMPGMDGFEVCRRLKDDEHLRHIPVVFLTAMSSDRADHLKAIDAGAEGFLTKPIEEAELMTQVRAMAKIKAANVSQLRENERLAVLVAARTRELEQELVVRRNAEEALRESEEMFRTIAEQLSDSIFLMDEQGIITYISPAAEPVFGLTPEEMTGHHFSDFVDETALPIAIAAFDEGMKQGTKASDLQLPMKRRDGTTFMGEWTASRVMRGPRIGSLAVMRDISDRVRTEKALADERRLLRTVIDNLPDAIYAKDIQARKIVANRADLEFTGAASESVVLGMTDLELFRADEAEHAMADDRRVLRTGQPILEQEHLFIDAQGRSRWLLTSKFPLKDDAGQTVGLVGIGRDITERKQAEEALTGERRLLRIVIDNLPDAVFTKDMDLRKTLANRAELEVIGAASELDVLGKTDLESYPPEAAERFMAVDWQVLRTGQPMLDYEELFVDGRGESRWLLTSKYPLKDDAGRTIGLVGIGHDITDRKRAETERTHLLDQIEAQARQVQQIIETVPQGIVLLDGAGRVLLSNPVAERDMALLAHGSGDRLSGLGDVPLAELFTPLPGQLWHEVRAGGRIFEVDARPIPGDQDHWVLVIDDVTLKRQARDHLQRQEQLAAIGQL
ncbi:MAG: PAS domain S-box protein, partial [Anaerolineae bacterium]|nr:PAS domain S-box protein [Anaerolineae bacterium]